MTDKETRTWWEYVDTGQHTIYNGLIDDQFPPHPVFGGWHRPSANDLVPTKDLDIKPSIDDVCGQYDKEKI